MYVESFDPGQDTALAVADADDVEEVALLEPDGTEEVLRVVALLELDETEEVLRVVALLELDEAEDDDDEEEDPVVIALAPQMAGALTAAPRVLFR